MSEEDIKEYYSKCCNICGENDEENVKTCSICRTPSL